MRKRVSASSSSLCRPCFHADRSAVAHRVERDGDCRVVDFARARFPAAGYVGDLDFADVGKRRAAKLDQVTFANLRVVQVEIELEAKAG